jgi:hypothetical protein
VSIYDTDVTYGIHPSKFNIWCDYPAEELYNACKLGRINVLGENKDQNKLIKELLGYNSTQIEEMMNAVRNQQKTEENMISTNKQQQQQQQKTRQ